MSSDEGVGENSASDAEREQRDIAVGHVDINSRQYCAASMIYCQINRGVCMQLAVCCAYLTDIAQNK